MKKLKKFAALLLVGVMALALLTACGGGGGSSTNKAEEQKVMEQIGKEKGISVASDAELRAVAEKRLDESLQYKVFGYAGAYRFYQNRVGNDLAVTITARHNYEDTFLSTVLTYISQYVKTDVSGRTTLASPSALRTTTSKNLSPFPPERGCKAALRGFLRLNPLSHALRRASSPERGSLFAANRQMPKSSPPLGELASRSDD